MFYTYVLKSRKNGRLYTGSTKDPRKRFKQHIDGKSAWSKKDGLVELIYYEAYLSGDGAWSREEFLKSCMGKRYLKNRLKRFLSLTG